MIKVLSVTIYKAGNDDKVYYEAFKDKQFESESHIQTWMHIIEKQWFEESGIKVKAYPVRRKKPTVKLDLFLVLETTAKVMEVPIADVIGGSRKREFVDVRKIACNILSDSGYMPLEIEKQLPFRNRIVYRYIESIENKISFEPGFEARYNEIKDKVLDLAYKVNGFEK